MLMTRQLMLSSIALGMAAILVTHAEAQASWRDSSVYPVLPRSVQADVVAFYQDWQQDVAAILPVPRLDPFNQSPVLFVSAESSASIEAVVTNKVIFRKFKKYDVWLMQQDHGVPRKALSTVGIFMDMTPRIPKAYYFELAGVLEQPQGPRFSHLSAQCFACHASGPRYLRPGIYAGKGKLGGDAWITIKHLNATILQYGIVDTFIPPNESNMPAGRVAFHGAEAWKPLAGAGRKVCQDCHSAVTGIRAPLLQQHIATAKYLEHHGTNQFGYTVASTAGRKAKSQHASGAVTSAMPPSESASLFGDSALPSVTKQMSSNEPVESPLVVRMSTSFGDFELNRIHTSGSAACGSGYCEAKLTLDFRHAQTGIALRDSHLHSRILNKPEAQSATILVNCLDHKLEQITPAQCSAKIHWLGKEAESKVTAKIQRVDGERLHGGFAISSLAAASTLREFGLEPPRFMAVAVADSFSLALARGRSLFIPRAD
jgi:hypothetical protein